jgi:hypothetical protein
MVMNSPLMFDVVKFYLDFMSGLASGLMESRSSRVWEGNRVFMEMPSAAQGMLPIVTQRLLNHTNLCNSHTLIPPLGYKIAGIAGSSASWVDGFSLIIQH